MKLAEAVSVAIASSAEVEYYDEKVDFLRSVQDFVRLEAILNHYDAVEEYVKSVMDCDSGHMARIPEEPISSAFHWLSSRKGFDFWNKLTKEYAFRRELAIQRLQGVKRRFLHEGVHINGADFIEKMINSSPYIPLYVEVDGRAFRFDGETSVIICIDEEGSVQVETTDRKSGVAAFQLNEMIEYGVGEDML